jgi:DNA polymerase
MNKTTDKQKALDQLRLTIIEKKVCKDLADQATQLVFGEGDPNSDVVFIGEAPGKNEDIQGKPFVGAAGRFLNEMLGTIKMKREDVYITNIVKYRPPNNRDPLPEEKKDFWPYLVKQLSIIAPKLIVTLGRHSGLAFLPELYISGDHGNPKRVKVLLDGEEKSFVILPLFHPAAALYNGGLRQTLLDDFQNIPIIMKKITKLN